jgi:hypothetical protein
LHDFERSLLDAWATSMPVEDGLRVEVRSLAKESALTAPLSSIEKFLENEAREQTTVSRFDGEQGVEEFFQSDSRAIVHLRNASYFAELEGRSSGPGTITSASVVRLLQFSQSPNGNPTIDQKLAEGVIESSRSYRHPSLRMGTRNLFDLLSDRDLVLVSHRDDGKGVVGTFRVANVEAFRTSASLRHVEEITVQFDPELDYAPIQATATRFSDASTKSVKLGWSHKRDANGRILPSYFETLSIRSDGDGERASAYRFVYESIEDGLAIDPREFTLSAYDLPEPPEPKASGSYRTQPWLYYFFGGVLCVAVGAFFIHRVTRKSGRA